MPFDPDFKFAYTYIEARDPHSNEILHASPYLLVKTDGEINAYLPRIGDPIFTTAGKEFHLGQSPPRWFGSFANIDNQIILEPAVTRRAGLFLSQAWDRQPYDALNYRLYQSGVLVETGEFPAGGGDWAVMDPVNIPLASAGAYTLEVTYDQYSVGVQPGQARMVASFDTTQMDKDPPTLLALNVVYDGETTDLVPLLGTSEVRFRVQDLSGLSQVSLSYRDDNDWIPLSLTNFGDEYTAQLPTFANGAHISLRIEVLDAAGNSLIYEVVPAFGAGVSPPMLISPANDWVTQDREITFTWEAVPEATGYRIQIDTSSAFTSPALISDTISTTSLTRSLSLGTWYWHALVIDGAGNESAYSPARRFIIAKPVVQVSVDTGDDRAPATVQATDGTLWVVWESSRSGNADIWYKTSDDDGTTWSPATQLTTNTAHDRDPAIAQAADGTLWVVWESFRGSEDIWYKTSADGGTTWSTDAQLAIGPGSNHSPVIMQATDGTLWVVWQSYHSGNTDIWYKTSADGGTTWSSATQLTTHPGEDYWPTITQAADGAIWVAWERQRRLWYRTSSDSGASWLAEAQIDSRHYYERPASLTVAGDDVMWLANQVGYIPSDIWYQISSDNGATWSTPQQWTRFVGNDDNPSLAPLSGDRIGIVWQSNRSGNDDIWFGIFGEREDIPPPMPEEHSIYLPLIMRNQ